MANRQIFNRYTCRRDLKDAARHCAGITCRLYNGFARTCPPDCKGLVLNLDVGFCALSAGDDDHRIVRGGVDGLLDRLITGADSDGAATGAHVDILRRRHLSGQADGKQASGYSSHTQLLHRVLPEQTSDSKPDPLVATYMDRSVMGECFAGCFSPPGHKVRDSAPATPNPAITSLDFRT